MGYKPKLTSAANTDLEISQLVPSKPSENYEPDYDYALDIQENSTFKSSEGTSFYSTDTIRFDFSSSFDPTTHLLKLI